MYMNSNRIYVYQLLESNKQTITLDIIERKKINKHTIVVLLFILYRLSIHYTVQQDINFMQ